MLQNIRDQLTGKVALVVLGVIAASFVFVGGASFTTIGSNYAAKVDDTEIGLATFENAYRQQIQANPQLAGLPDELRLQYRSNILEQLIQQRVIDNYLAEAGIKITDKQLTELVHQYPEFHLDGKFDRDTYVEFLQSRGETTVDFEESQRLSLRRNQLQRAIRGSSVVPPSGYRRFLNLALENRVVTTATITPELVASQINISDEMIQSYYDDDPLKFMLPETADVEFVEIRRDSIVQNVEVSEEELSDSYALNKDRYEQDEQRQARHILILFNDDEQVAETEANEVLTRLRSGESFSAMAMQYSKDGGTASDGGDLGVRTQTQMPDALGDAVFAMEEGELRGPVKGDFGYHIVQLDSILASGPLPFEQVRASLLAELQEDKADGLFISLKRQMSDALFEAVDIRSLADIIDVEVQVATGFTRDSAAPFDSSQLAVDAIFDPVVLSGAQISDMTEIDANRVMVFSVVNHNEAVRDSLASVRGAIIAELTSSQSESLMAARAQSMLEALEDGAEFKLAAEDVGATAQASSIITRNSEDTDQSLAVAVFTAIKPAQDSPTLGSVRNSAGGYTVYSLDAVIPGQPQNVPLAERDAGKEQLVDQYGLGDFVAFVQALRSDADVIINEDALAAQDLFQ